MSFYNEKYVGTKARSDKTCKWCNKEIKKGTPHYVLISMESYGQYPLHEICHEEAGEKCNWDMENFLKEINKEEENED